MPISYFILYNLKDMLWGGVMRKGGKYDDLGSSKQEFPEEVVMTARSVCPWRGFHMVLYSVLLFPGLQSIWIFGAKVRITQDVCKRLDPISGENSQLHFEKLYTDFFPQKYWYLKNNKTVSCFHLSSLRSPYFPQESLPAVYIRQGICGHSCVTCH